MEIVRLQGKEIKDNIEQEIKDRLSFLNNKGIKPCLAILRVGENPSDVFYEKSLIKSGDRLGISVKVIALDENVDENVVEEEINRLNEDDTVHGILMFRPLPKHLNQEKLESMIDLRKDVDCINKSSIKSILLDGLNSNQAFAPCTSESVMEILKYYDIDLESKKVVVIGRSLVVARPLVTMFLAENATVTICHSKTKNLEDITRQADIIVVAIAKPKYIDKKFIGEGQIIIDVGINQAEDGRIVGDVDFEEVSTRAYAITPVPGGVGTVTTSILFKHVVIAALKVIEEEVK